MKFARDLLTGQFAPGFFGGFIDPRETDLRFGRTANAQLPLLVGPKGPAWSSASSTVTPSYLGNYSPQTSELTVLVRAVRYGAQPDSGFGMAATLVQVSGTQDPFQLFIKTAGERVRINTTTDDTVNSVETTTDWPVNQWQTGVYAWSSGSAIEAYRNGVRQTLSLNTYTPGPAGILKPAQSLRINNSALRLNGAVGAVLVWGRKLPPSLIAEATERVDSLFRRKVWVPVSGGGATSAADSGSVTVSGSDASGIRALVSSADPGSLSIAGQTATGSKSTISVANSGAVSISGFGATDILARRSIADAGAITISGSNATGIARRVSSADSGSVAITGVDATGAVAGGPSIAAPGAVVITGFDATAYYLIWPAESDVRAGVQYGPTGVEYTGTMTEGVTGFMTDIRTGRRVKVSSGGVVITI